LERLVRAEELLLELAAVPRDHQRDGALLLQLLQHLGVEVVALLGDLAALPAGVLLAEAPGGLAVLGLLREAVRVALLAAPRLAGVLGVALTARGGARLALGVAEARRVLAAVAALALAGDGTLALVLVAAQRGELDGDREGVLAEDAHQAEQVA